MTGGRAFEVGSPACQTRVTQCAMRRYKSSLGEGGDVRGAPFVARVRATIWDCRKEWLHHAAAKSDGKSVNDSGASRA